MFETSDSAKRELYRLIGEGYKAMQEGRSSTIEEVREKLETEVDFPCRRIVVYRWNQKRWQAVKIGQNRRERGSTAGG